jgi:hypothetical protein
MISMCSVCFRRPKMPDSCRCVDCAGQTVHGTKAGVRLPGARKAARIRKPRGEGSDITSMLSSWQWPEPDDD